jgi:hypothetical protein
VDAGRFDLLARSLHAAGSRRGLVAALSGAALGGAAAAPLAAHDARRRCQRIDNPRKRRRCLRAAEQHNQEHGDGGNDRIPCDPPCPAGARCLHGACTCDPFANACPHETDGQCGCGAVVSDEGFAAACVDRNSACDLDKPCDGHGDCPAGSVCLLGCADPGNPLGTNRCSNPCVAA